MLMRENKDRMVFARMTQEEIAPAVGLRRPASNRQFRAVVIDGEVGVKLLI